ncbi:hypothetical protein N2152v2_009523 [Parachlorella kessleri]
MDGLTLALSLLTSCYLNINTLEAQTHQIVCIMMLALPGSTQVRAAALAAVLAILAEVQPSLEGLQLGWPGPLELGAWLAALPRLREASFEAPEVQLTPSLAAAPVLTTLQFSVRRLVFTPNAGQEAAAAQVGADAPDDVPQQLQLLCLPRALVALDLLGAQLRQLPAQQLSQLPSLRSLDISCNPRLSLHELAALSTVTGLQELALSMAELPQLPPHLSLLSDIRVLYLHSVLAEDADRDVQSLERQFQAMLSPMQRLAILSVSGNRLQELPTAVAGLPNLRALYLEGNRLRLPPCCTCLSGLEELSLDWGTLLSSHAQLATSGSRLSRLYLSGSHSLGRQGIACPPLEVARSLAACPRLDHLVDVLPEGSVPGLDIEVARLMYALPTACPRLHISATESEGYGYGLESMPPSWRG